MKSPKRKKQRKRNLIDRLYDQRDRALEHVVDVWLDAQEDKGDPDRLNKALDVLTVAHSKATFEYASNSFSS